MEEKTKVCRKCGRELPLSEFPRSAKSKDGHINTCKTCKASYEKSYIVSIREKARLYDKIAGGGGGAFYLFPETAHAGTLFSRVQGNADLHRNKNYKS